MNKAFTREPDGDEEESDAPETSQEIPGGRNYITPQGAERLQSELRRLKTQDRPEVVKTIQWAAGNGDRSENGDYTYGKKRLREIDRRLRFLSKRLESLEVIDPAAVQSDQVLFGATVTFRDEEDNVKTFTIVGIDEVDVAKKRISWASPLAKSLLKGRVGDIVQFQSPRGSQEIEVVAIRYLPLKD